MMKLPPDDMLHLLVHRHRYATKSSVVDFVRFRHPRCVYLASSSSGIRTNGLIDVTRRSRIEESAETFSRAVFCVLRERNLGPTGPFLCAGFPEVHGGVLDHERFTGEKTRGLFDGDAGVGDPSLAGFSLVHRPGRLEPSG
ncbi:hypothetical protein C8A01DRAFT_35494 [Parachaetomium inaequale]|uniref:Uncharacterized protein n=1 Tax=Parachaetomium inaequale TaxID=2588326 RepID=A0AAN6PI01_9PEZI|nr:hypothetical protein C8A01DRAFT_35494 [Parachaetomium inaequale]